MVEATSDTFNEIVKGHDGPVVVDFYADWCGPCRAMKPVLEEFEKQYNSTVQIVMVNVDDSPELAQEHDVQSVPNLVHYDDGEMQGRLVGSQSPSSLAEWLWGA